MSFDSLLNKTATIQARSVAQDATTHQDVETWSARYSNVRVRLDGAAGQEMAAEGSILAKASHVLFMRTQYKVEAGENRFVIDGNTYNILLVRNAGGHDHHQEILLEVFDPDAT